MHYAPNWFTGLSSVRRSRCGGIDGGLRIWSGAHQIRPMHPNQPVVGGQPVNDLHEFLKVIEDDYAAWGTEQFPWFRGEPGGANVRPLLPGLYRAEHDENRLLQFFRMRAPTMGLPIVPPVERIDQWLFVARHMGLPTRLLDWTEGALVALFFALRETDPVVWMLNPFELNGLSAKDGVPNAPTITWVTLPDGVNVCAANIKAAWQLGAGAIRRPVAVYPTNIHPFMAAQHSCFTVHGSDEHGLAEQVPQCLRRYEIRMDRDDTLRRLRRWGVSEAGLFPTGEALARELGRIF